MAFHNCTSLVPIFGLLIHCILRLSTSDNIIMSNKLWIQLNILDIQINIILEMGNCSTMSIRSFLHDVLATIRNKETSDFVGL